MHEKGMDIARLNFSHATHEDHQKFIDHLKTINAGLKTPIGIMLDTKGPEIRIGKFKEPVTLKDNEEVVITTEPLEYSTEKIIEISYANLPKIVEKGSLIYIADGTVELRVEEVRGKEVICKVSIGGEIGTRKNVNIPGSIVDLPAVSEQDVSDIEFGIQNGIDFIAQSFVKTPEDVLEVRALLKKHNAEHIHIIAKIESFQALQYLDEIIKVSDGIMVARGDLGVQIPIEEIPEIQKKIIKKCNIAGKPVITATQMLESMIKNPRPTRAEATDVANAIIDGTDAIMLSGETANGKHPLRVIDVMDRIARKTERTLKHIRMYPWSETEKDHKPTIIDSLSRSVCHTARDLEAVAIITCTATGNTARQISAHRPITPIIAITPHEREFRKLVLSWGVQPILIETPQNTDELIAYAIDIAKQEGYIASFDLVVITASIPFNTAGTMNMMKVEFVK